MNLVKITFKNYVKTLKAKQKIEYVRLALLSLALSPTRLVRNSFDKHSSGEVGRDFVLVFEAPDSSSAAMFFEEVVQMAKELEPPQQGGIVNIEVYRKAQTIIFNRPTANK